MHLFKCRQVALLKQELKYIQQGWILSMLRHINSLEPLIELDRTWNKVSYIALYLSFQEKIVFSTLSSIITYNVKRCMAYSYIYICFSYFIGSNMQWKNQKTLYCRNIQGFILCDTCLSGNLEDGNTNTEQRKQSTKKEHEQKVFHHLVFNLV